MVAQACNRIVVTSRTLAVTRTIGVIVLSMLKTIFFRAAIGPIRQSNAGVVPYPQVTRKHVAARTHRSHQGCYYLVPNTGMLYDRNEMKSLCHGLATPHQPYCKGVGVIQQNTLQLASEYITTVAVHSHRFSVVTYSQTVFTGPQQLASVCTKLALRSLKVATILVGDCQKVVLYQ